MTFIHSETNCLKVLFFFVNLFRFVGFIETELFYKNDQKIK